MKTRRFSSPELLTISCILVSFSTNTQLRLIKSRVAEGAQPWSSAYSAMLAHPLASLSRTSSPTTDIQCSPASRPNIGCIVERRDALTAYAIDLT